MVASSIRNKRSQKFSLTLVLFILIMVSLACSTGSGSESAPATQPPQVVDQNAQATQVAQQVQETMAAAQAEATEPPVEVTEEPVATTEEVSTSEIPGVEVNEAASEPGDYYYKTEFDAVDDWVYYVVRGNESGFTQEATGSKFEVEILDDHTYVYFVNDSFSITDVQLDTKLENLGQNTNYTGLICRFSEEDLTWYEANILNTGEYFLYMHDKDGFHLLYSGASTAINMGKKINEYTFVCKGDELTLGINGVEVRKIPGDSQGFRPLRNEGQVGIVVASENVYPLLVDFDWFTAAVPY